MTNQNDKPQTEEAPKGKGGRPRIDIDWAKVEGLVYNHCTQQEVADIVGCSKETLIRRKEFAKLWAKKRAEACADLRASQMMLANSTDAKAVTMLIWLGKNLLEQKEPKAELGLSYRTEGDAAKALAEAAGLPAEKVARLLSKQARMGAVESVKALPGAVETSTVVGSLAMNEREDVA